MICPQAAAAFYCNCNDGPGGEGARQPCAARSSRLMQGTVPAAAAAADLQ
jgi:hypothetical protein